MKTIFAVAIIVLLEFSIFNFQFSNNAIADASCQPIYGGGQTCTSSSKILIDKKVLNPKTNLMVDNLGINDPKYKPDFIIYFQVKLTNTSDKALSKIVVRDTFPQYVAFNAGLGKFDNETRTLTFNAEDIKSNESKTYTIVGKVVSAGNIPQRTTCVVNQATVTANNNQTSQDNAQLCIENVAAETVKGGFPVASSSPIKKTPATGPESIALFSLIPAGILGWVLRKFDPRPKTMI